MNRTNRALIVAEIARMEAAKPSPFQSFNDARAVRLAEHRSMLAALPPETEPEDAGMLTMMEAADASTPKNRARARWA